jgi:hypothetical protein
MDKAITFFIDNYSDVKAVLELDEHVREKLPQEIIKLLYKTLDADFHNWNWGGRDGTDHIANYPDQKKEEISWWDDRWVDQKQERGTHFGLYPVSSSSLIEPDEDDRPFLYLYQSKSIRNLTEKALRKAINDIQPKFEKSNMEFNKSDGEGTYLVKKFINETISIERLKDPNVMCHDFLGHARNFTETFAPIVNQVAGLA